MEYAIRTRGDTGASILYRSMKGNSPGLDLKTLAAINRSRKASGLDPIMPPEGCRLHRHLVTLTEARKVLDRAAACRQKR